MKRLSLTKFFAKFRFQLKDFGQGLELVNLREIQNLRKVFGYFSFLLLVWGLYRYLVKLPENVEELILKPVIWLGSLVWMVKRVEKKPFSSLGLTFKNWSKGLIWGMGLGLLFSLEGFLLVFLKNNLISLSSSCFFCSQFHQILLAALITGFTEELVFRGFFFDRLQNIYKKEWQANLTASILFALIHLPITIFVLKYNFPQLLAYGFIVFTYSLGAGFAFARSKTILAPVILHFLWRWPVLFFG